MNNKKPPTLIRREVCFLVANEWRRQKSRMSSLDELFEIIIPNA